jgi:hypothetical protein
MFDSAKRFVSPLKQRSLRLTGTVGGTFLLLAVLSPTGLASMDAPPVVLYACVNTTTNAWKYTTAVAACPAGFVKENWNQRGPRGPIGPSNGYSAFSDSVSISTSETPVVNLTIPAGSFMVYAKAVAYIATPTSQDAMVCDLFDTNGSSIDQGYASVGLTNNDGTFGDEMISLAAPLVTSGGTISVACLDEQGTMTMFRNRLTAIMLGSVSSADNGSKSTPSSPGGARP